MIFPGFRNFVTEAGSFILLYSSAVLRNEGKDGTNMASKRVAILAKAQCVACGACEAECPRGAIAVHRGCYAVVSPETCIGCGKCTKVCPTGCVQVVEREATV